MISSWFIYLFLQKIVMDYSRYVFAPSPNADQFLNVIRPLQ